MGTHPIFESDFDCLTDQEFGESSKNPKRAFQKSVDRNSMIARLMIGAFSLCSYFYAMWALPIAAGGFLLNISLKYPELHGSFPIQSMLKIGLILKCLRLF